MFGRSTGVYPETHGIIGNYMLDLLNDPNGNEMFSLGDLNSTKREKWWKKSEPIWVTATRNNKRE